ncbi:arginase family protein [Microbacterium sp. C7(2022)]|uniref:arginase family protein n=1 Tax=Microbacterium sp. C7(2022) TaxID=2992759 RepID=UPI00237BB0BB|nr:arginase family protein [Microbacterium sp. C7(2022)]MDE0547247.1 arginase family protein [Microbacterium sp. C7(2022)]
MTRFLIVPQWQGSPSSRSMRLIDGAQAIAGDLPRAACTVVDVPVEAGEAQDTGIRRFTTLARVRESIDAALATLPADEPVLTVGGDCGVAIGAISHAATRHPDLAVLWLDAHGDFHAPSTSPSGAFAGMATRAATGQVDKALNGGITASRIVIAGARAWDDDERESAARAGVSIVGVEEISRAEAVVDAVVATGARHVYIHVDLDVLDPSAITGVTAPVPFGCSVASVVGVIAAVRARLPLVGSSLCGFAPASPAEAVEDQGSILRIIGALA